MTKTLFVCTGNICRSSTAEAIARHKALQLNLSDRFIFDSAGTTSYHQKEPPDQRSVKVGKKRGVSFDGMFSRQITSQDFENFDLIMCMDRSHLSHLYCIAEEKYHDKIHLFLQFCGAKNPWDDEVIDPYYGSGDGFDKVYDVIEAALNNFFAEI